jgi:hypothetical protein
MLIKILQKGCSIIGMVYEDLGVRAAVIWVSKSGSFSYALCRSNRNKRILFHSTSY